MTEATVEDRVRELLGVLLMDVPLARGAGSRETYLEALERACLGYPVFPGTPSPVDAWLDEAEGLAAELGRVGVLAALGVRRAVVAMRRVELDAAVEHLDAIDPAHLRAEPGAAAWADVTRARILVRRRAFEDARAILDRVDAGGPDGAVAALARLARGELALEADDPDGAEAALTDALERLAEASFEERVQALQALGFVAIGRADLPAALHRLDRARHILRGAGAWPQVIQMDLAVGGFHVSLGEQEEARALFQEALELCEEHPQPELETLLRLALARSRAAEGEVDEAVGSALEAAGGYARQGNVVGFVAMIVFIANLYADARRYPRAYDTLAVGLAIAGQRGWPLVTRVLRSQVNRLRNDVLGPVRFDAMVREMIRRKKAP